MTGHLKKNNTFIGKETDNDWFTTDMSIYHCEFDRELYTDQLFDSLAISFPDALNNAVAKRRAEFLAGRYCALKSLQKFAISAATVGIGKQRNPLWPESIIGSISHCGSHAVAITALQTTALGVGIDIENEISCETVEKIQQQILCAQEIALISQNIAEKPLLFTLAFSAKESFFKAAYPSVEKYFDFDAVSLVAIDPQARSLRLCINTHLHEKLTAGRLINCAFRLLPDKKIVTLIILNHE